MGTKVIIEQRNLRGSDDSAGHKIATVYIDGRNTASTGLRRPLETRLNGLSI